jgi:type II secretory pathway pseudopilin PulG
MELLVAMLVLALVLVSVAYSMTSALTNVGFSRQQQAATGLANKAIEEIRGLPFSTLQAGLNNSDTTLPADQVSSGNISGSGASSTWTFKPTGETIVHSTWASGTPAAPLYPHMSTSVVNHTNYTVKAYPTSYNGNSSEYRVTVIVTWSPSDRPGAVAKVSDQTVIFSPSNGCLEPTTHPYAAPCQPDFQSSATLGQGYIEIEPPSGSAVDAINGISLTTAELYLPRADSNIDLEQVANLVGGSYTSGGTITLQGSPMSTTGQDASTAQADSDPGSNAAPAASNSISGTGNQISASSGGANANTLLITPNTADTGNAVATAAAGTAQTSAGTIPSCADLSSNPQSTGQPCGDATVSQNALSASMDLFAGSEDLGRATLASVATPPSAPSTSMTTGVFAAKFASLGGSYCPNASGDGCVHAGAQRQIGTVRVGGLPQQVITDGKAPTGWSTTTKLFTLSNYSASVAAENGIGTNSPALSAKVPASSEPNPTLSYWNGSGYTNITWSSTSPPSSSSIPIAPVSISYAPAIGSTLTITEAATVTFGTPSTTSSGPSGCSSSCAAAASAPSPILGDVIYNVQWNGQTLADLDVHIDLGTLMAGTAYQEAPSAG